MTAVQHLRVEEQRDGMLGEARESNMDLRALGRQLGERKSELMSGARPRRVKIRSPAGHGACEYPLVQCHIVYR
jgi:hypothetical protein